jgi:hypothetical protein
MSDPRRLARIRSQASSLPTQAFEPDFEGSDAETTEAPVLALLGLQRAMGRSAGFLLLSGLCAPALTGDFSAAWLCGLPALSLLGLLALARRPQRRRVALLLSTAICGFLALACAPALGALQHLVGPQRAGIFYQLAGLLGAAYPLLVAAPAWREFNRREAQQTAWRRLREEL